MNMDFGKSVANWDHPTLPQHPGHREGSSGAGASTAAQSALVLTSLNWVQSPENLEPENECPGMLSRSAKAGAKLS